MLEPEFVKGFVEGALGIATTAEDATEDNAEDDTTIALEPPAAETERLPAEEEFGKEHRRIELD